MRTLCSSVLAMEAIVVLLATSLATSVGSVANTTWAWAAGLTLMVLLALAPGMLTRRGGLTLGWILQVLVLASAVVVGWSMVVIGVIFVILWWFAIHLGTKVDAQKAAARSAPGTSSDAQ